MKLWIGLGIGAVIAVVAASQFLPSHGTNGNSTVTVASTHVQPKAKKVDWNGKETRSYDVTWVHENVSFELRSVVFAKLRRPSSNVTVFFQTGRGHGRKAPAWTANPRHFTIRDPALRSWTPVVRSHPAGAVTDVTLSYMGLPTREVAAGELGLSVWSPEGPFVLGFKPLPPPSGHQFAELR